MVSKSTFRVTQGSTRRWSRPAASGEEILANFCDHCGARLFHERAGGDAVNVKGGALDDTTWLKPVGHQWLSSAQPWMRALVDRLDTLKYPGQAPKSELIARYGSAHG